MFPITTHNNACIISGPKPRESKGTLVTLCTTKIRPGDWCFEIITPEVENEEGNETAEKTDQNIAENEATQNKQTIDEDNLITDQEENVNSEERLFPNRRKKKVLSEKLKDITLKVQPSASCIVGIWQLIINTYCIKVSN